MRFLRHALVSVFLVVALSALLPHDSRHGIALISIASAAKTSSKDVDRQKRGTKGRKKRKKDRKWEGDMGKVQGHAMKDMLVRALQSDYISELKKHKRYGKWWRKSKKFRKMVRSLKKNPRKVLAPIVKHQKVIERLGPSEWLEQTKQSEDRRARAAYKWHLAERASEGSSLGYFAECRAPVFPSSNPPNSPANR